MGPSEPKVSHDASVGVKPWIKNWAIPLHTWPRKLIAVALIAAACGTLMYRTWWLFLAAWITRTTKNDPGVYERAIRYDPGNADYHFVLAQIYNYSTLHLNVARAGEEYMAAVRLNPYRASHWLELSKYYEEQKDDQKARDAMTRALERDPNYAGTHWAAANLYFRLNDLTAADFELRRTADLDVSYLPQVLDLVWRFYGDPGRIMSTHVPNTREANLKALNYFISQKNEPGAALAWLKLKTFATRIPERVPYVEYLVAIAQPHEAWRVFTFPSESADPVYNASFETEPANEGFDWRFAQTEHSECGRDSTIAKEGNASWLVRFDGKENIDYSNLAHWLPVTKGRPYKLSFWMKTEAISTNEGMYVEVDGQASEKQTGTTYWRQFTVPFKASSDLVTIRLRRTPSKKFDNLLKGKVWVDDFVLN